MNNKAKTISICAKTNDMFSATLMGENRSYLGEYDGYVPKFLPGLYGDYIILDIDIETGQILNWIPPTKEDLVIFKGN